MFADSDLRTLDWYVAGAKDARDQQKKSDTDPILLDLVAAADAPTVLPETGTSAEQVCVTGRVKCLGDTTAATVPPHEGCARTAVTGPPLPAEDVHGKEALAKGPDASAIPTNVMVESLGVAVPSPEDTAGPDLNHTDVSANYDETPSYGVKKDIPFPLDHTVTVAPSSSDLCPGDGEANCDLEALEKDKHAEPNASVLLTTRPIESLDSQRQWNRGLDQPKGTPNTPLACPSSAAWELLNAPERILVVVMVVIDAIIHPLAGIARRRPLPALLYFGSVLWALHVAWQATPYELTELFKIDLAKHCSRVLLRVQHALTG